MTTSSTYNFSPSVGEFTLNAFARLGIRRPEITQGHLADAAMEANLLQVEWSSRQPNLWTAELYDVPLVAGTASYTLPTRMISPMAVFMTVDQGSGNSFDRILGPMSTFEYESLPDKETQAQPTTYWLQRTVAPVVHLWPVPDDTATYVLHLRILSQIEDANIPSGITPQIPYRWFDAFTAALAARLAVIYKPELEDKRKIDAERAWQIAAKEDIEYVPFYIIPGMQSYFR